MLQNYLHKRVFCGYSFINEVYCCDYDLPSWDQLSACSISRWWNHSPRFSRQVLGRETGASSQGIRWANISFLIKAFRDILKRLCLIKRKEWCCFTVNSPIPLVITMLFNHLLKTLLKSIFRKVFLEENSRQVERSSLANQRHPRFTWNRHRPKETGWMQIQIQFLSLQWSALKGWGTDIKW